MSDKEERNGYNNANNNDNNDGNDGKELTETSGANGLPDKTEEIRAQIEKFSFAAQVGPAKRFHERLLERIPREHIKDFVDHVFEQKKQEVETGHVEYIKEQEVDERESIRKHKFNFVSVFLLFAFVAAISILCIILNKDDLTKILLPGFSGLAAGGFGGYGLGVSRNKNHR